MAAPLIEVVIPARGECPWFADALASLAAQQLLPDKVFVIDDGLTLPELTDNLGERLLGDRYKRLKNPGSGISDALNFGVLSCNGEWIARMDSDDVAHPQRLSRQLAFLRASSDDVLGCGTQVRLVDKHGRPLGFSQYPSDQLSLQSELLQRSCFSHPTLMLRREVLLDVPYRSALDGAEDVDLVLRLGEHGQLLNVDEALLDYRIHVAQPNFQKRARQTALQELAFRLAESRRYCDQDLLRKDPGLAEKFVEWRLGLPGYMPARQAMTGFRYMVDFLRGGQFILALSCLAHLTAARPWRKDVRAWVDRVRSDGPGSLRRDICPFAELNLDESIRTERKGCHA